MRYPELWIVLRPTDLRVTSVHATRKGAARMAARRWAYYRKVTLGRRLANGEYVSTVQEEEES